MATTVQKKVIDKSNLNRGLEPWKFTAYWAEERYKLEQKILARITTIQIPWSVPFEQRRIGNQTKCLWLHLKLCELDGIVRIAYAPTTSSSTENLFGILSFQILDADRFTSGDYPLPSRYHDVPNRRFHYKTYVRLWQSAGFVKDGNNGMIFSKKCLQRMAEVRIRADKKRSMKDNFLCLEAAGSAMEAGVKTASSQITTGEASSQIATGEASSQTTAEAVSPQITTEAVPPQTTVETAIATEEANPAEAKTQPSAADVARSAQIAWLEAQAKMHSDALRTIMDELRRIRGV